MNDPEPFLAEHLTLTRRFFLGMGAACMAGGGERSTAQSAEPSAPELVQELAKLEPYFTPPSDFRDVSRGKPLAWPLRLCKVHWAALLPGLPAGEYTLHCRTIDEKGQAQPLPRPFRKSGHCAIEAIKISVKM